MSSWAHSYIRWFKWSDVPETTTASIIKGFDDRDGVGLQNVSWLKPTDVDFSSRNDWTHSTETYENKDVPMDSLNLSGKEFITWSTSTLRLTAIPLTTNQSYNQNFLRKITI